MKEIKLTRGMIAIVDDEDFEQLNQYKWCATWDGWNWYAVRRMGNKKEKMHRVVLGAPIGIQIDHINGNGLDNTKENLRLCTNQENQFNQRRPRKDNKLGVKGVWWKKKNKKFEAKIHVSGKNIYLGLFPLLADADSVYRKAEEKYFGEFARKC